jgi:PPOX class probable F420-dependent enzyme
MVVKLTKEVRAALEEPEAWHLATVNPDGSPQATTVWLDLRGERILVNTAAGRKKPRNLAREPRVALSWSDPRDHLHSIAIQGRVVESYEGERADADIDALARKYLGAERYPWRKPDQRRISYLIEPTHVLRHTAD